MKLSMMFVWLLAMVTVCISCAPTKFKVVSFSMAPTLMPGDVVSILPIQKSLQIERGDVICFRHAENGKKEMIFAMRVVGLPEETILLTNEGLVLNGSVLTPIMIGLPSFEKITTYSGHFGIENAFVLGVDQYFVLGDNLAVANDSRRWGALDKSDILGRIYYVKKVRDTSFEK